MRCVRAFVLASVLALGSACGSQIDDGVELPVWDGQARQICEVTAGACPDPAATAAALVLIDMAIADVFGERSEDLRRLEVTWRDDDACPRGCTGEGDRYDPTAVHVYEDDGTVAGSALVHEAEHVIARDLFGNRDDGHELAGFWRDPALPGIYSVEDDVQAQIVASGF